MARGRWMARFARWHIWLGWAVAVPMLLWLVSGLVMVARPIETVRGEGLRLTKPEPLPPGIGAARLDPGEAPTAVKEIRTFVQRGRPVTLVNRADGSTVRYDARTGRRLAPLTAGDARAAVEQTIKGGDKVASVRAFAKSAPPLDLRKEVPSWQVTLTDGTRVYVNRDSGEIEAVRTRWWRFYDFMWGLHIMDPTTREDTHNPFVIGFGAVALLGALLGTLLLFRRRRRARL